MRDVKFLLKPLEPHLFPEIDGEILLDIQEMDLEAKDLENPQILWFLKNYAKDIFDNYFTIDYEVSDD